MKLAQMLRICVFGILICAMRSLEIETIFAEEDGIPLYEDFNNELHKIQEKILQAYPKYSTKIVEESEDIIVTFPPPKGSNITQDAYYKNMYTMITDVNIRILVERFVRMNIEEQSLTLVVQEMFMWKDQSLRDETIDQYPGFQMDIPSDRIWIPPIYATKVFEASVLREAEHIHVTPGTYNYSGEHFDCHMKRTMMYTIPCSVDVRNFPFDVHNCSLVLTQPPSWNYRMHFTPLLDADSELYDTMSIYTADYNILEWQLTEWHNEITTKQFAYDPEHDQHYMMDQFSFYVKLQRRATFYFVVLLVPCFLLNILTLVIFTLSLKDLERENFAMNLLLSYVVLILLVVQSSPPSGDTMPLLGLYTIVCTSIVMLAFVMSLILIEIHEHYSAKQRKMGKSLIRIIDNRFCKCMFTNKETYSELYAVRDADKSTGKDEVEENNSETKKHFLPKSAFGSVRDIPLNKQWKIFCKLLNFIFFVITFLAHCVIAFLMFYLSY